MATGGGWLVVAAISFFQLRVSFILFHANIQQVEYLVLHEFSRNKYESKNTVFHVKELLLLLIRNLNILWLLVISIYFFLILLPCKTPLISRPVVVWMGGWCFPYRQKLAASIFIFLTEIIFDIYAKRNCTISLL